MRKIYDTFCFFNELDILELRLNILDPYVDYFVLSESSVTHTGIPKPYYYEDNKERFSKFNHKIIHLKIEDTPNDFINLPSIKDITTPDGECISLIHEFIKTQTNRFDRLTQIAYGRDFFQKECVRRGLVNCNDEDIILFSDCDEIPNPEVLLLADDYLKESPIFGFSQTCYYYYLNLVKEHGWIGTKMSKFKDLKSFSFNEFRGQKYPILSNGGVHYSYMGGPEAVKHKLLSFSAQEMVSHYILNSVEKNIENGTDPFFRSKLVKMEIDENYPEPFRTYILKNKEKYKHLIL